MTRPLWDHEASCSPFHNRRHNQAVFDMCDTQKAHTARWDANAAGYNFDAQVGMIHPASKQSVQAFQTSCPVSDSSGNLVFQLFRTPKRFGLILEKSGSPIRLVPANPEVQSEKFECPRPPP